MIKTFKRTILGCCLALSSIGAHNTPAAAETPAPLLAISGGEVTCSTCINVKEADGITYSHYFWEDECGTPGGGGGNEVANPNGYEPSGKRQFRHIVDDEGPSQCRRCGGTSDCHSFAARDAGKCAGSNGHILCNNDVKNVRKELEKAVRMASADDVRRILKRSADFIEVDRDRQSVLLFGCDGEDLIVSVPTALL